MKGWHFKPGLLHLFVFCLLGVPALQAQSACPWLTQGTAAAYLDGDVTLTVRTIQPGEGVCIFTRRQGSSIAALQISVSHKHSKACPRSSPSVVGVGSHAVACRSSRHGETKYTITGNVRQTSFTVRLTTRKWHSGSDSAVQRRNIVEQTAEEVAGNLF